VKVVTKPWAGWAILDGIDGLQHSVAAPAKRRALYWDGVQGESKPMLNGSVGPGWLTSV
jgi:hypothetical protein